MLVYEGKIIAHRGFHTQKFPENSLGAFNKAQNSGYPIELDVRLTKDNKLVVFHDATLFRMCRKFGFVSHIHNSKRETIKLNNTRYYIPLLSEVLALVNGKVPLYIELKCGFEYKALADALAELINAYHGEVTFHGFNPKALKYIKSITYKKCYLSCVFPRFKRTKKYMLDGLVLHKFFVPKKPHGVVFAWTANYGKKALALAQRTQGVFTNLK